MTTERTELALDCGCVAELTVGKWHVCQSSFLCPERHNLGDIFIAHPQPERRPPENRVALSKPEQRIATWCDCGKPVAGFAGTVIRCECGLLWSVARMLVGDVGGVQL